METRQIPNTVTLCVVPFIGQRKAATNGNPQLGDSPINKRTWNFHDSVERFSCPALFHFLIVGVILFALRRNALIYFS